MILNVNILQGRPCLSRPMCVKGKYFIITSGDLNSSRIKSIRFCWRHSNDWTTKYLSLWTSSALIDYYLRFVTFFWHDSSRNLELKIGKFLNNCIFVLFCFTYQLASWVRKHRLSLWVYTRSTNHETVKYNDYYRTKSISLSITWYQW